jgi:uncharacterized protein
MNTGWLIAVHVQPGAKRSEIAGHHGERLKVRVAAPAADGRANAALLAFMAGELGVALTRLVITKGERSRDKLIVAPLECDPTRLLADPR